MVQALPRLQGDFSRSVTLNQEYSITGALKAKEFFAPLKPGIHPVRQ